MKRAFLSVAAAAVVAGGIAPLALAKTVPSFKLAWSSRAFEVDGTVQYGMGHVEGFTYQNGYWVSAYAVQQLFNQIGVTSLWVGHTLYLFNANLDTTQLPMTSSGDANVVLDGTVVLQMPHLIEQVPGKHSKPQSYIRLNDVKALLAGLGFTDSWSKSSFNVNLPTPPTTVTVSSATEAPGAIGVQLSQPVSSVAPSDFTVTDANGNSVTVTNVTLSSNGQYVQLAVSGMPASGQLPTYSVGYDGGTAKVAVAGPVAVESSGQSSMTLQKFTLAPLQTIDANGNTYAGTVTYTSSNTSVLEVTTDNQVIGISAGTATVTATDAYGDSIATLQVTVQ